MSYLKEMEEVRKEAYAVTSSSEWRPSLGTGLAGFWKRAVFALKLMFLEKELFTFAVLQWACIAAGYYLWVQMIGWIPEEVWREAGNSEGTSIADLILFAWSFFVVGAVAFPLGLLSGCMGATHFLNRMGRKSTIAACLKMVLPRAWPLWIFHWIDGWWTVNRILDRLPKKNDRRSAAAKALSEALYYAWKVATIGILPALVTGRGLIDSGKRSIDLVRRKFADVAILRAGYSGLCWILGIGTYIGTIIFFIKFPGLVDFNLPVERTIFKFYFWAGVPIVASVGVVMLLLRPVYVISACDIYADYVSEREENLMLPPPPPGAYRDYSAVVTAAILVLILLAIVFYRTDLGVTELLSR